MANIFTQAGEDLLADILNRIVSVPTQWFIAWGTGAGTAAKADTTLFTEASEARVVATESQPTSDTNRFVGTMTAAAGKTITNAGVLSASSAGTLFIHSDFAGLPLAAGDKIEFTFDINWA
jgi:hypothetical protein